MADDLQTLANVLDDTPASPLTRQPPAARRPPPAPPRPACSAGASAPPARSGGSRRRRIVSTLATAESFGVTFLTEAIRRAPGTPSAALVDTLKAANTAEYDHVVALRELGGRQFTLRLLDPRGRVRRRRLRAVRVDRDRRHRRAHGLPRPASRPSPSAARPAGALAGRGVRRRGRAPRDRPLRADRARRPPAHLHRSQLRAVVDPHGRRDDRRPRGRRHRLRRQGATPAAFYDFPGDPVANGSGW